VLGGRAIGRLWAVIRAEAASGWRDEAVRFQVVWTAAGFIWTACAIVGTVLGVQGAIAMAMVVGMVQCLATIARGVLRGRIIKDASARLDDRARRAWQVAD
jgi:hypothetical protein